MIKHFLSARNCAEKSIWITALKITHHCNIIKEKNMPSSSADHIEMTTIDMVARIWRYNFIRCKIPCDESFEKESLMYDTKSVPHSGFP